MSSNPKAPMLGSRAPSGPGGRDCACCGEPPGKDRTINRRTRKRSERQRAKIQMKKEARDD